MRPLLYSCYFVLGDDRYRRMGNVLRASAQRHCPGWDIRVEQISPLRSKAPSRGRHGLTTNTDKLHSWCAIVDAAANGDHVLLLDSDMMIRGPLDGLWHIDFDVAYTHKGLGARLPINGGTFAVKVNERSRTFMKLWLRTNDEMLANPTFHGPWRTKYAGINQASLGYILEQGKFQAKVGVLDCAAWNCCFEPLWDNAHGARIVHFKSALRRSIFAGRRSYMKWRHLVEEWYSYEQAIQRVG